MTIEQAYQNNELRLSVTKYKDKVSYMLIGTDATDSVKTISMKLDKNMFDRLLKISKFDKKECVMSAEMYHYSYGNATPENKLKEIISML